MKTLSQFIIFIVLIECVLGRFRRDEGTGP